MPVGVSVGGAIEGDGAGAGSGAAAGAGAGAAGVGAGCGAGAAFGATLRAGDRFLGFVTFLAVRLDAFLATTFFLVARFADFFSTRFFALLFALALLLGLAAFLFAFLAMWMAPLLRWSNRTDSSGRAQNLRDSFKRRTPGRTSYGRPPADLRRHGNLQKIHIYQMIIRVRCSG